VKLYTKGGDKGFTSLIGGRVSKTDCRVEAYGELDELNSFVGLAHAQAQANELTEELAQQLQLIMHELFDCGADLAYAKADQPYKVKNEMVEQLEYWIDKYTEETSPLEKFILPGGSTLSAQLHICRTVCRRAERRIVEVEEQHKVNEYVLHYINRLSDYFFVAARKANELLHVADVCYERSAIVFKGNK
jgi:cob(I)alamin adenosyltransferase